MRIKCQNCGVEFTFENAMKTCPFCNALISPEMYVCDVKSALRWIVNERGIEVFNNGRIINGMLADLANDQEKDRRKIRMALDSGVGSQFYNMYSKNNGVINEADRKIFRMGLEECGFTKELSLFILNTFLYSVELPEVIDDNRSSVGGNNIYENNSKTQISDINKKGIDDISTQDGNLIEANRDGKINNSNQTHISLETIKQGSVLFLGSWSQGKKKSSSKEAIEWVVLAKKKNRVLLITKLGLFCKKYNETYTPTTWEKCTLRKWLNTQFITLAFSDEERKKIRETRCERGVVSTNLVTNERPTNDNIFILSENEANKYLYSILNKQCNVTKQAKAQGALRWGSTCRWWLRGPGAGSFANPINEMNAVYVDEKGSVDPWGTRVTDLCVVRPALWINL